MDIKEKLKAIKVLLAGAMPDNAGDTPAEEAQDQNSTLKDGTIISWDGELKPGVDVTITTADGTMAPPDGSLELQDGTVLEIAGGKVTKVIAPVAPAQGMGEQKFKTHEEVKAALLAFDTANSDGKVNTIASILKFMFNEQFGWMLRDKEREQQIANITGLVTSLKSEKTEIENLKTAFTQTVELVELMNETVEPAPAPPNAAFLKQEEKNTRAATIADALKQIKK